MNRDYKRQGCDIGIVSAIQNKDVVVGEKDCGVIEGAT